MLYELPQKVILYVGYFEMKTTLESGIRSK